MMARSEVRSMNDVALVVAAQKVVNAIIDSIDYQENPDNRVITECEFHTEDGNTLEIWIRSDCDGWCEDVKLLTTLRSGDDLCRADKHCQFVTDDFIGLSETMAKDMVMVQKFPLFYEYVECINNSTGYALIDVGIEDLLF